MTYFVRFRAHVPGAAVALVVLFWLAIACLWIDKPGLHYDESIFVSGAFPERPGGAVWKVDVMGRPVAVLIMSYMGALKGWFFGALLEVANPTVVTVRFPLLLLAAITVAATYKLAATLFTRSTGIVALCLLTTDVTFLFTSRLDWGPVVIQRLCLVVGTLLVVSGSRDTLNRSRIIAGFCVLGIGLFDKLTFVWIVFGLMIALLMAFPRYVLKLADIKLLPVCVAALVLPLAPAMYYGAFVGSSPATTLEKHGEHYWEKYAMLAQSLDGTVLRGPIAYQFAEFPTPATDQPTKLLYRLDAIGDFEPGWFRPAVILAVLLIPLTVFLPGGRSRMFVLLFCTFSLLPMALVEGAGSVHHSTLIYPFPHILVASSLVSVANWTGKRLGRQVDTVAIAAATAFIAVPNSMNIAHQYAELVQFGGKPIWSEAIYELSEVIKRQQAEHVLIGDWGIEHQLILLSHNRLPMWAVPFASPEDPEALRAVVHALEQPNTILVRFASAELSPSPIQHELVDQAAHTSGHVLRLLHTIEDKQRRIIYHIYRVHPDQ